MEGISRLTERRHHVVGRRSSRVDPLGHLLNADLFLREGPDQFVAVHRQKPVPVGVVTQLPHLVDVDEIRDGLGHLSWSRDDYVYVFVGGALIIGAHHNAFLFACQRYVTGGVAAVLLGLVPLVTPAHTRLVSTDGEFTAATALGVALGFVGVVVIADPDPANLADSVLGVALVLSSALAFAIAAVVTSADRRQWHSCPRRPR